jgi:hypothetical protein
MTDRVMAAFALAVLLAFLGILVWFVPRVDLGSVVAVTALFVVYDFFVASGRSGRS